MAAMMWSGSTKSQNRASHIIGRRQVVDEGMASGLNASYLPRRTILNIGQMKDVEYQANNKFMELAQPRLLRVIFHLVLFLVFLLFL